MPLWSKYSEPALDIRAGRFLSFFALMKFSRLAFSSLCSCIVRLPQLLKLWVTLMIIVLYPMIHFFAWVACSEH